MIRLSSQDLMLLDAYSVLQKCQINMYVLTFLRRMLIFTWISIISRSAKASNVRRTDASSDPA